MSAAGEAFTVNQNLSRSIEELALDNRTVNVLWNNEGLRTLGDIAALSRAELLRFGNFGHLSLARLEIKLKKYGIELHGSHNLYLGSDLMAEIDEWRLRQPDKPGQYEAIRRLIESALKRDK